MYFHILHVITFNLICHLVLFNENFIFRKLSALSALSAIAVPLFSEALCQDYDTPIV